MKKAIFLFCIVFSGFLLVSRGLHAAESDTEDTTLWENDSDIEQAMQDGDIDYETYSNLLNIYDNKIDINSADVFQLQSLPGLSQLDAARIVSYRLKHGYFKNPVELINPDIIDEETFDKIKIFIAVEMPSKITTKGDVLFKTKSNSDVELDTTEYPRTYDILRLRVLKLGSYMKFGATVEGDARYENYYQPNSGITTGGEMSHAYRLNKAYVGYERGPFITQAYLGNYRAGFGQRLVFDNSGQSSPLGLYPDDTYSSETQVTFYQSSAEKDKYSFGYTTNLLNGFGGRIKQGRLDFTGFYSKSKYPVKTYVLMNDGKSRLLMLEDRYEETLLGSNVTYKVLDKTGEFEESYIGTTLYTSKREGMESTSINIWKWPPQQSFAVYGTNFVTGYKGFNFVGEAAKVNGWGGAWNLKMAKKMGKLDVVYSHRDYDIDFYNPWAKAYSKHTDSAKFKCRDEQGDSIDLSSKITNNIKLQFVLDQFKHVAKSKVDSYTNEYYTVYETPTTDREILLKYNWRLPRGMNLQIDRKWKDLDIYKNEDSSEKASKTTNVQLKFRPSKVSDITLKYQSGEDYYDNYVKYLPKDSILTRATYDITANLEIAGEVKFADSDLRKLGGESRQYWLQLTDRLSRFAKIKIRYVNKYASTTEEYQTVDYYSITEPGYANKWEVRVDYKW